MLLYAGIAIACYIANTGTNITPIHGNIATAAIGLQISILIPVAAAIPVSSTGIAIPRAAATGTYYCNITYYGAI